MQIWCLLRQFRQGDVRLRASDPWTAAEGWTNNVTMRLASNAKSDWDILGLQLVGGIPTPLKNMKVSMTFPILYMEKQKIKCSKPPTRLGL